MKEIPLDAKVICLDGECGKSSHIIIEKDTKKVTHIVVKVSDMLDVLRYLVPIEAVARSSAEAMELSCTKAELRMMRPFTEMRFFNASTSKYEPIENFDEMAMNQNNSYLMWADPLYGNNLISMPMEAELIPEGEFAIHRGASIEATDGHIGKVEEFLIDSNDKHLTHLVLQEGHFWHKRDLTLPISAISSMDEEHIYLNLDKEAVKSL